MSYLFNVKKLETRMARAGVDMSLYSIGSYGEGMFCISTNSDGEWETFTGERSQKFDLKVWPNEEDACLAYFGRIAWNDWH
jgi:hypothetical protein